MPRRTIRWWWLIAAFLSGLAFSMWVEELTLSARESRVEFSAPRVHFLTGKPLERMRNSDQVQYLFRATLWSGSHTHILKDTAARFVVSYDLFGDNFKVTKLEPSRKTATGLTDVGVEAWCLQEMSIDVTGVGGSEALWARLDIRALDGKESGPLFSKDNITDSGISLTSGIAKLIDVFSRPAQAAQPHWGPYEAGPATLDELRRVQR
jgi:hypothetical protein